jgi:hypothetical protein
VLKSDRPSRDHPQGFHNQQVMQLVPGFGKVDFQQVCLSPVAEGFIEMQDRQVGKVGNAGNGFQQVEAWIGAIPSIWCLYAIT